MSVDPTASGPGVPYARGDIIGSSADDLTKLAEAWRHVRSRWAQGGGDDVHLLSGLDRAMHIEADDLGMLDDELASALLGDELRELGLEHLGGDPDKHDIFVCNRTTAGLLVMAELALGQGDVVIGISPRYSHPAVARAVARTGARFVEAQGLNGLREALAAEGKVDVLWVTRLAVSYEILDQGDLEEAISMARARGARVLVDDAGGARVGPAIFDQPKMLELGVDAGVTGLDKYGTTGPRVGLIGGDKAFVAQIRTRAYEMGLEARQMLFPAITRSLRQYRPERVRELVETTRSIGVALATRISANRILETPVSVHLRGEDILEMAMERASLEVAPCVPFEATAGLAMLMLRDHGIVSVHFAGVPPGTSALLIKFIPPEALAKLGGPERFAQAVDESLDKLAELMARPEDLKTLVLGADG